MASSGNGIRLSEGRSSIERLRIVAEQGADRRTPTVLPHGIPPWQSREPGFVTGSAVPQKHANDPHAPRADARCSTSSGSSGHRNIPLLRGNRGLPLRDSCE